MKRASVFWFTGLSGSGKTTVAEGVRRILEAAGIVTLVLDGDEIRNRLHRNLGFTREEIMLNNRLVAGLCESSRDAYDVILVPIISPYEECRRLARERLGKGFYEVYFDADMACVMQRDVKGLYAKAKRNELNNLIGYAPTNPYEVPAAPDWTVCSKTEKAQESTRALSVFILAELSGKKVSL